MERKSGPGLEPAHLPPGTQVGPWRVASGGASGTYGAVYRAIRVGQEQPEPVALKLALLPWDPRFAREAVLLDRIRHPSVPRLRDHGHWRHPSGAVHPCLVLEWVEGTSLYEWAQAHSPTSREMSQCLAQLAGALQTTHAAGAIHRDVKGGNVLVRHSDGRALLIDFGAGHYTGAERLTWQELPPGTNAYRAPEAWRCALQAVLSRGPGYTASPVDDVFALGVTAYRLVTGQYPPPTEPDADTARIWHPAGAGPRAPLELNPQVDPRLSALILRMLSVRPEARGTASELAVELERLAEAAGPESAPSVSSHVLAPLSVQPAEEAAAQVEQVRQEPPQPVQPLVAAAHAQPLARSHSWLRRLAWAAAFAMCVVGMKWVVDWQPLEPLRMAAHCQGSEFSRADAGTVALGDTASVEQDSPDEPTPRPTGVRREVPKKPLPGQQPAPCGKTEEAIRGGCWIKHGGAQPPCPPYAYEWEGACYVPLFSPPRPATSEPP